MISNDAVVFGILMVVLGFVFYTSNLKSSFWKKFYTFFPVILLCYFIPSLLNTTGIVSPEKSNLYFVASRYLLPTSLVLLTLSVDLKEISKLGSKALIMFFTGTVGIIIGGPIAIIIVKNLFPNLVLINPEELARGMTTIAGSWIGGGANQTAMKEIFNVDGELFSKMVTVDVLVGNAWLAVLLIGVGKTVFIDKFLGADSSSVESVKEKIEKYNLSIARIPDLKELIYVLTIGFGITGISHLIADNIAPYLLNNFPSLEKYSLTSSFFWLIVMATTFGVILSFTRLRDLEGVGASKIGTIFIYILVATIGLQMNLFTVFDNPGLFLIGLIWISVHVILLFIVAILIKAPYFFVAVGSQANVGGAASAPVVAAAFHPSLAAVGVLLAVLGYAVGTYAAYLCGIIMQSIV
ncbi:uncharacterized protein METZ01_LOCUS23193 [marine metagenome]|uniref:DUF819 domain-containing protein n=1 Tax=marine metagenome TaxID=408172 RepID=A0A381PWN9_9ZZZZ